MKKELFTLLMLMASIATSAQRTTQSLNDDWRFLRQDANVMTTTDNWQKVTLPHSWNAEDGQRSGKNRLDDNGHAIVADKDAAPITDPAKKFGYYRGTGWYARTINIPVDWKDKRIFVRFEAAGQVARIYVNGQMLGEHRGGFTAFCYELTPYIKVGKTNELRMEVDNTHRQDIPPLSGDFNVNGGLYRPAELIVTDKVCISPLDFASPGVYITTKKVDITHADVEVRSLLSNGMRTAMSNEPLVPAEEITVETIVRDAMEKITAKAEKKVTINADCNVDVVQTLTVENPILWEGRKNPYLYSVTVNLKKNGEVIDSVEQPLGIRTFAITDENGFLLNGKPYPIYGVGRHQDLKNKAWALTAEDNEKDYSIMKELGATAIRFAHYPQSENMHDIADREGFLVWDEIPLVNEIRLDYESKQNVRIMMQEMVRQLYNHPSVAWWGIYNEIENIYTPPSENFLTELRNGIRQIDNSSRFIVGASDHGLRPHNLIPEVTCFNNYPGWYHGNFPKEEGYTGDFSQYPKWLVDRRKEIGMRTAISEYGAGGDATQHTEGTPQKPKPAHGGPFQPEEWLAYVHEENWRIMKDNENLWGTFLWAMFDFASCMRNEGSVPSVNTKGIVSQDRQIKKDPYYMYKANWNLEPMVYIASRRAVKRTLPQTDIKVYSNCKEVTLKVNGKKVGKLQPDEIKMCLFKNILLQKGSNKIEVTTRTEKGKKITDSCEWVLE
ncbi:MULTISPECIES: glycoside hydrolase family 2 protein [Bacteroides]|uniref:glycoside hydrolase family 2 protein n=1 Tax=Bacteroides TaxID=816 RepID=UPI00319DFD0C